MSIDGLRTKLITLYGMRMASGKSGSSIARLCGTTYRSLRNWERGDAIPNIVNVYDLLQIYGYSYYELDFTPFYTQQNREEKQKRIDAATMKRTPVSNPSKNLSFHDMRQKSGYSGAAAAEMCGVTYRSIRNWEKGKSIPNIINVDDLLNIYGYSFYELDLVPFFTIYEERSRKIRELDAQTDNPFRDRRRFEQGIEIQTNTPKRTNSSE